METVNICQNLWPHLYQKLPKGFPQDLAYILSRVCRIFWPKIIASEWPPTQSEKIQCFLISMKIDIWGYFEVRNWLVMMNIAFRIICKMAAVAIETVNICQNRWPHLYRKLPKVFPRPLTICRFCWRPFWKRWHLKDDPECNFHHYLSIPHFKITLDINFHWNQRALKFCRFCRRPFARDFLWSKYSTNPT
jgi:hypothetical protein